MSNMLDVPNNRNPKNAKDEETGTSDYCYEDFPVELHVGGEVFKISSSRLSLSSPVFKQMFTLPQPGGTIEPIVLHNDVEEFKEYLWYIHAEPFEAKDFIDSSPSAAKCSRILGIANTAHMYGAEKVASRAMNMALDMLMVPWGKRSFYIDKDIARRLLRGPIARSFLSTQRSIDVLCDAMFPSGGLAGDLETDPISLLKLAKEFKNKAVLAHAYFYVLEKGDSYWQTDSRLDAEDRRRLLCGSHALYKLHKENACGRQDTRAAQITYFGWSDVRLHKSIKPIRSQLWDLFDAEPWNLVS